MNQTAKAFHRPKKATNNRHMETPVTISAFMTGMLFTVIRGVRHRRRILARPMACKGARHSGNQRGKHGYQQRGIDTLHNEAVLEQLRIPVQGEALPHRAAVAGIEGEDDENENRRIQEYEYQRHEDAVSQQMLPFHSITACSSPSPKRFITSIHTTTMAIITSAIAAPSWGL